MKINSICIVGGGSAGWMTASAFSAQLKNIKITLVESPLVSKIGVGESTLTEIHKFLDAINIDNHDWMKECDSAYKLGIRFNDFYEMGSSFLFPFFDSTKMKDPLDWFIFKKTQNDFDYSYVDHVLPEISLMCKKNRITADNSMSSFCMDKKRGFRVNGYQVDAHKFARFLMEKVSIPNGVKHIVDHVTDFDVVDGQIKSIKTQNGLSIEADLFVDCTGFKSLLIEGVFKSKRIKFDELLNDSAFFAQVPYDEEKKDSELQIVTDCTAIDNGWVWNIPLWSRVGTGYVFSSKYVDKNAAQEEYIKHLSKRYDEERIKKCNFNFVEIRNGKHEKCWVSNVLAIGLSYGFIEPLESTGLVLVHQSILNAIDVIKRRDGFVSRGEVETFNIEWDKYMERFRWFVAMHFFFSKRTDTEYWRACVDKIDLNWELDNIVFQFLNSLSDTSSYKHNASNPGMNFIGYAMGFLQNVNVNYPEFTIKARKEKFINDFKAIERRVDLLPSHYQFLRENIYL